MSQFAQFNLNSHIINLLDEIGFTTPTPIQEKAIPQVLNGSDIIACAQTGTGKTAAFLLPLLHILEQDLKEKRSGPQVLILVPTRELAMQVADEAKRFCKHIPQIKTACIYGGIPYPVQKKELSRRYQILVATPGRLIDHLERGRINLSQINHFVLDEADRMLDMGFIPAVEAISELLPKKRQTLLFSATIDGKVAPICKKLLSNPFEIRISQGTFSKDSIDQKLYYVDGLNHKVQLLEHILGLEEVKQTIVFTSTIQQAKELSSGLMQKGYLSDSLHGDMSQRERTRTINKLKRGSIDILVATDVAARGIDVATLTHVINFDLPFKPEDFIHRIGRTGRAGASGFAITFAAFKEALAISKINKLLGKPIVQSTIEGLEPKTKPVTVKEDRQERGGRGPRRAFRDRGPGRGFKSFSRSKPRREDGDSKPSFFDGQDSGNRREGHRSKPSFFDGQDSGNRREGHRSKSSFFEGQDSGNRRENSRSKPSNFEAQDSGKRSRPKPSFFDGQDSGKRRESNRSKPSFFDGQDSGKRNRSRPSFSERSDSGYGNSRNGVKKRSFKQR